MQRILLALSLGASLGLAGCDVEDWGSSDKFKEDFSYSYAMKPGGKLFLESFNGAVEVRGWDKDSIEITGTKYAATEDLLKQLKIDISAAPDSVRVRAIRPMERRNNCGAKFIVRLPKNVILDRIESSNGSIRVENVEGYARLKTSNGGINIWEVKGDLEADTSNSAIEVGHFLGAANLRTSNGRIKADGVRGSFEGNTSNGGIDVTIAELSPGKPLRLVTSNSTINATLEKWNQNDVYADTSNGSINLRLPDGVAAKLKADTSNGSISTDFEVAVTSKGKTHIEGTIGSGGPNITLDTSNGNIRLQKKI